MVESTWWPVRAASIASSGGVLIADFRRPAEYRDRTACRPDVERPGADVFHIDMRDHWHLSPPDFSNEMMFVPVRNNSLIIATRWCFSRTGRPTHENHAVGRFRACLMYFIVAGWSESDPCRAWR